jgi:hypothetical protein
MLTAKLYFKMKLYSVLFLHNIINQFHHVDHCILGYDTV